MNKKILSLILVLFPLISNAEIAEVEGVSYRLNNSTHTAEVIKEYNKLYTGQVIIKDIFTYQGVEYTVTSIGENAFADCIDLTSVTIPNTITSIKNFAFCGCRNINSINIPNSVTSIGAGSFSATGLTSIIIPNSVTSIENSAFSDCNNLTSVNLPNSITTIKAYTFSGCYALTSISIPNTVTSIDDYAFFDCKELKQIVFPSSLSSLSRSAFWLCDNIERITSYISRVYNIADDTFTDITYLNATLSVPTGKKDSYKAATGWKKFINIVEENPTSISEIQGDIPLMIFANNGTITVKSQIDGQTIYIYGIDGHLEGHGTIHNGQAILNTSLHRDHVAIVKIGEKAVKVVMQ